MCERVTGLLTKQQSNCFWSNHPNKSPVFNLSSGRIILLCFIQARFFCVLWAAGKWIFDLNKDFWLTETGSPLGFACIQLNPHCSWFKKKKKTFLLLLLKSKSRALCFFHLMERMDVIWVYFVFACHRILISGRWVQFLTTNLFLFYKLFLVLQHALNKFPFPPFFSFIYHYQKTKGFLSSPKEVESKKCLRHWVWTVQLMNSVSVIAGLLVTSLTIALLSLLLRFVGQPDLSSVWIVPCVFNFVTMDIVVLLERFEALPTFFKT